jgi:hypothetical protein
MGRTLPRKYSRIEVAVLAVPVRKGGRRTYEVHCHDVYQFSGLMKRLQVRPT